MKIKGIIAGTIAFLLLSVVVTSFYCGNQSLSINIFTALADNLGTWGTFSSYFFQEILVVILGIAVGKLVNLK